VYTDVTEVLANDKRQLQLGTQSVAAVLVALYTILFFIVRHGRWVIRRQYEQRLSPSSISSMRPPHDALNRIA